MGDVSEHSSDTGLKKHKDKKISTKLSYSFYWHLNIIKQKRYFL